MTNTNSNSDILSNVSASINSFLALPVYGLLASIQFDDITLKNFVPSKDKIQHILSGTQETFRQIDPSHFDFTLPVKAIKPDKPIKPEPFSGKAKQDYYDLLESWSDWDTTDEALLNIEIDRIATRLIQHDILRKFAKLVRVCQFVSNHDASMFVHHEELDLHELPQTVRTKILDIYKASYKANPSLEFTGGLHKIDLTNFDDCVIRTNPNPISVPCSLDTVEGINSIIAVKNTAPSASYGFMSKEILGSVLEAIRQDCNGKTLLKIITRLDTHSGGSKNSTTILANLRMLHGFVPTKGKAKTTA